MQFSTLWYLQRLNLFEEFTQAELLRVARAMDMEELEKHEGVFQIGDPAGNVYFLIEGLVKIYRRSPSKRKITLAILHPGEIFGDHTFTPGESHEHGAEALEPAIVGAMTAGDFRTLLYQKPDLALRVVQCLGRQKRSLERKIADLVFKDVPTRLAETLLELSEAHGQPCVHGLIRELAITQQELADLIGATRQVVNSTLKRFQQQGLIALRRQRICIADPSGLSRIAEAREHLS
jgi:CRP/FNR family cyclic AMP-dependent transcriptional regulator